MMVADHDLLEFYAAERRNLDLVYIDIDVVFFVEPFGRVLAKLGLDDRK
jgi:hypothetical protein